MPQLQQEIIGHCRHCRVRTVLNADLTTPWHTIGIFTCQGVGELALDIETPKAADKRRLGTGREEYEYSDLSDKL